MRIDLNDVYLHLGVYLYQGAEMSCMCKFVPGAEMSCKGVCTKSVGITLHKNLGICTV